MLRKPDPHITRKRYDRMARLYDILEWPVEHFRFASWRARLKRCIRGSHILEVGVGTGKNLPYYHEDLNIIAIDLSPRMLVRAHDKAEKTGSKVNLIEMDVQQLNFPDHFFDTIFATFVFCSVPDPVAGLKELRRVCTPDGRLFLLDTVRPGNAALVRSAGWQIQVAEPLSLDIIWWIEAVPERISGQ
jgi:ubiquinone/menaquinone biosynthesis C-methylase UbiE